MWGAYVTLVFFLLDRPAERTVERVLCFIVLPLGPRLYVRLTVPRNITWFQSLAGPASPLLPLRSEPEASAACIGALLGSKSAQEALVHGQENFRAIRFSHLNEAALRSPREAQSLWARSETVALGECDCVPPPPLFSSPP